MEQAEVSRDCPYCGESIDLFIDTSIEQQDYIEDCSVCCRPIRVSVFCMEETEPSVTLHHENEA